MTMRHGSWFCLFCSLLFSGLAQQNGPAGQSERAVSVPAGDANGRITLDVVVTDKNGRPVPGLQQRDFTLLNDRQPRSIASFHASQGEAAKADTPVEVVLLVDEVNAPLTSVAFEREQIEKYLRRNGGELPYLVTLVVLSDSGAKIGKLSSRDGNALAAELSQIEAGLHTISKSQGIYGAAARQQLSLRALGQLVNYEATKPGRKLVIWISPGWPLLTGPGIDLTAKAQETLFNAVVALSDGLRRARVTLYGVDPLGVADAGGWLTSYWEEFLKGVRMPRDVQIANLGLQVLAYQSGGRVLNSSNDVEGEIATCVTDASAFYILSFDSFDGLPGGGEDEYHSINIKIDKPGLIARTRTGYYGEPETVPAP
jgi:VWFA-related protein